MTEPGYLSALALGLAGAGHCLGMCGGIAAALNLGGHRSLAVTLLEMANNHIYFAEHLPSLTDIKLEEEGSFEPVEILLEDFAFGLLGCKKVEV